MSPRKTHLWEVQEMVKVYDFYDLRIYCFTTPFRSGNFTRPEDYNSTRWAGRPYGVFTASPRGGGSKDTSQRV